MPIFQNDRNFYYCEELIDSRLGSAWKAGGKRDYTRKFLVKCKDNALGANIVCGAPGILPYAPYATEDGKEFDYQALCVDIRLERPVDPLDGFHKIVVVEYSTEMPEGGPRFDLFGADAIGTQNNPEFEPPHIEWEGDSVRESPPYDLDGKGYLNSARQPYKPAPGFETGRAILVYSRNERSHDVRKQIRYSYSVNSDTFLGEEPGTVQLMPPRAVLHWRGSISFWRVTYRFRFNTPEPREVSNSIVDAATGAAAAAAAGGVGDPFKTKLRSWQPKILDAGMMQLQETSPFNPFSTTVSSGLPVPIYIAGHAVTEPVLLNGKGRRQTERDANGNLKAVWNDYRQFLAIPFTPILVGGFGGLL